jgi:hypothetical protein
MRKFRNPRYAPEILERKLFPSAVTGLDLPPVSISLAPTQASPQVTDVLKNLSLTELSASAPAPPTESLLPGATVLWVASSSIDFPPPPPPPPAGPTGPAVAQ